MNFYVKFKIYKTCSKAWTRVYCEWKSPSYKPIYRPSYIWKPKLAATFSTQKNWFLSP